MSLTSELEKAAAQAVSGFHVSNFAGAIRTIAANVHQQKIDYVVKGFQSSVEASVNPVSAEAAADILNEKMQDFYKALDEGIKRKVSEEYTEYMRNWAAGNEQEVFTAAVRSAQQNFTQDELKAALQGFRQAQLELGVERITQILEQDAQSHIG